MTAPMTAPGVREDTVRAELVEALVRTSTGSVRTVPWGWRQRFLVRQRLRGMDLMDFMDRMNRMNRTDRTDRMERMERMDLPLGVSRMQLS
ncbi:MAG: hypothetical protein WCI59_12530 [Betaproteobacteria bacterium]